MRLPCCWRKGHLSCFAPGEQSAESKTFTDFNDLANPRFGMDGVKRQVQPVINKAVEELEQQKITKLEWSSNRKELRKFTQKKTQISISNRN